MALSNTVTSQIQSTLTGTAGLATNTAKVSNSETNVLASATTLYSASLTIAASTPSSIDLSGALNDPLGDSAVFTSVMDLYIKNTGAGSITFGGTNSIPLTADETDLKTIAPGASIHIIDPTGITVTAGTGDLIILTPGATETTADLIVIGSNA